MRLRPARIARLHRHADLKIARVNGLTPGVSYTITTNAVGAAGPSKWSSPVSQFAD
jgi:hypothetical protein